MGFSLITINLFLPPSQLLIHPFFKFYSNSPRSPAFHYAIAKQLIYYNILLITSSILLCADINQYGFNYNITPATKNLFIYVNITCIPCIFLAFLFLFKFYSSFDIWASNGVHLVFYQDMSTIADSSEVDIQDNNDHDEENLYCEKSNEENCEYDPDEKDATFIEKSPSEESTALSNGDMTTLTDEQNETTEADRNHLTKKKRKVKIITSCCSFVKDVALVDVRGKWVNVSD